jgi:hypothetical protein
MQKLFMLDFVLALIVIFGFIIFEIVLVFYLMVLFSFPPERTKFHYSRTTKL